MVVDFEFEMGMWIQPSSQNKLIENHNYICALNSLEIHSWMKFYISFWVINLCEIHQYCKRWFGTLSLGVKFGKSFELFCGWFLGGDWCFNKKTKKKWVIPLPSKSLFCGCMWNWTCELVGLLLRNFNIYIFFKFVR